MPSLENARHEAFARGIVEGKAAGAAYVAAGYKPAGAEANASRLIRNDKVAARIAELKAEAAKGAVATAQQVLEELTKIGLANMQDFVGDNDITHSVASLNRNHAAAIQEYTVEHYTDGHGDDVREVKKIKLKLADKRGALVDLGRHHKLFTDKSEHSGPDGGPVETKDVSDIDRARRIAFFLGCVAAKKE